MIVFRRLTFARAGTPLVRDASLQIGPDWKIGVVGANGSGKSTLFALFTGEHHAESGDLEWPPGWVVSHVAQEAEASGRAALDFVIDGDLELRAIENELATLEQGQQGQDTAHHGERIGLLHGRYAEIDGYGARARAAALLHGLGFSDADFVRPVSDFSGGWRVRLSLAQALMRRSDMLLLDEPTNHLDLDAVLWLEGWLKRYRGVLLIISHDRDFLDAVVDHTLCLEMKMLKLYSGGYSDLERQRYEALALQQSMYEKQQREIAHLQHFVDRFRAKATKARQAQSRLKALERMERIAAAHVDTPFTFRFPDCGNAPDPLLLLAETGAAYGERRVLGDVTLTLRAGERIALLGRNGAGKSTLMKLLAGVLPPSSGERREGKGLVIGYFTQHQVEALRADESPLQHLARLEPQTREQELRDYLGGFDFRGDMATRPTGPFSGGEKSRLALALVVRQKPNLLLLDEPTNHLDLEMREALNLALQETDAGVVLVSHDRHLLRTTADSLYLVADGRVAEFDGDLDDYAAWLDKERRREMITEENKAPSPGQLDRQQKQQENAAKKAQAAVRRPLEREAEKQETRLTTLNERKSAVESQLADTALYAANASPTDKQRMAGLIAEQTQILLDIEDAENRLLEALDALDRL